MSPCPSQSSAKFLWSDHEEDDVGNNFSLASSGNIRKVFSKSVLGDFQTTGKSQKIESPIKNATTTTSVLSPFAKVFVPHIFKMKSQGSRIDASGGSTNESHPTARRYLPGAVE